MSRWSFLVIFVVTILSATSFAGDIELRRGEVIVSKGFVRLGDVSEISGFMPQELKRLVDLQICQSPLPGRSRWINMNLIKMRLLQAGFDQVEVRGAERVLVSSASQELDFDELVSVARCFIEKEFEGEPGITEVCHLGRNKKLILPVGKITLKVDFPKGSLNLSGGVNIPVVVNVGGRDWRTYPIRFKVRRFRDVLVAAHPIRRGHVIEPGDLSLEMREVTFSDGSLLFSMDDAVGKMARHSIREGSVVRGGMLEDVPVVKRGSRVSIVGRWGGVRVSVLGEAREDGVYGDRIKVRNLDSKRIVEGVVIDANRVEVNL